jgi:hypothetical protein
MSDMYSWDERCIIGVTTESPAGIVVWIAFASWGLHGGGGFWSGVYAR